MENIIFSKPPLSPKQEIMCYETLWAGIDGVTFSKLNKALQGQLPSSFEKLLPPETQREVDAYLDKINGYHYNILIRTTADYPDKLKALELPILYFSGDLSLIESPCVSIVGARKASSKGVEYATNIAVALSKHKYTIVSGLAEGIDTAAQRATIAVGGRTIGVIGTPLNTVYPKSNVKLQEIISKRHLLISHIPFFKYSQQDFRINRLFFPERNKVMAALSEATIIIEASNTSGTLTQARECLRLGKKLIILKNIVNDKSLTWPSTYIKRGAHVAETITDIKAILAA